MDAKLPTALQHVQRLIPRFLGLPILLSVLVPVEAVRGQQAPVAPRVLAHTSLAALGLMGIEAAAVDAAGHILLIDSAAPRVVVADRHLRLLSTFDGRPPGAGHLREPVSVGILAGGGVAVLDRAERKVVVFHVVRGGKLEPVRAMQTDGSAEAMCILGDTRIVLYGLEGGMRLRVLDVNGKELRSLAPGDSTLSPRAQDVLSQGQISCNSARDEVLLTSKFLPAVEAFRVSGGQRDWTDTLRPFRPLTVEQKGTSVSISSGHSGYSLITTVASRRSCRLFQTRYDSRLDSATIDTVTTYTIPVGSRSQAVVSLHLPSMFLLDETEAVALGNTDLSLIRLDRLSLPGCTASGK